VEFSGQNTNSPICLSVYFHSKAIIVFLNVIIWMQIIFQTNGKASRAIWYFSLLWSGWGILLWTMIFPWDPFYLESSCALQFDVCNCTSGDLTARMAAVFTCCLGCCGDGGPGHAPLKDMPTVQLDTHHMGKRSFPLLSRVTKFAKLILTRREVSS